MRLQIASILCLGLILIILACGAEPSLTPTPTSTFRIFWSTLTPSPTATLLPTATITPTPVPGPMLKGNLIVDSQYDTYKLVQDPVTGNVQKVLLSEGSGMAGTMSPDKRYVLGVDAQTISKTVYGLLDLSTGEITELAGFTGGDCIRWAPDGKKFTYMEGGMLLGWGGSLYVYSLASAKSEHIYSVPFATYGPGFSTIYGELSCGDWVGDNHFLFQRYVGSMPSKVTTPSYREVRANTTTLAVFGTKTTLLDLPQRLYVKAVSPNGSYVVFATEEKAAQYSITRSFTDFESIDPLALSISGPCSRWNSVQFSPDSSELIFGASDNVCFIGSDTLESHVVIARRLKYGDCGPYVGGVVKDFPCPDSFWVGDPHDRVIAFIGGGHFAIGDLSTGGVTYLAKADQRADHILAWIP